ncbi:MULTISPECIES: hypothetical protein [unclassified Nocardioides]|uniref:hypothetical protein n=1 Tax=unclassified Nocardioides TaxID=2615069 RepID=UPI0000EB6166|nr:MULTISPECIES: hypothetical protein [unclassified Nocardioides]ABL81098.1 hypothetical protein Noca_1584 [Nocardioides sp. JS614]
MYGTNGRQLREELTTLLRQHRIQQRLGGPGSQSIPVTTTPEQREDLGQLIQRYRYAALAWCLHAVVAADPRPGLQDTSSRGPAEELRFRLTRSINMSNAGMPSLDDLSKPQDFAMVESWRQVARAAVFGEHDFPGLMDQGRLSYAERMTVLKDAAEVTRGLVVLDKRYENIPGWIPIRERARLDRVAQACATFARDVEPDYSVDHKGWRPPSATIDGGPLPGIGGVLQAEHNMLVHLSKFPTALNLRRVMDGQRIVSHEAARRAPNVAPELIEKWLEREQTYKRLIDETRDVGGLIGHGGLAAAEAANAVSRLRRVHVDEISTPEPLRDLDKLFTRTDARVAAIIEQGVAERLYFVSVKAPRIVDGTGHLVSPGRERYVPIHLPVQTDLLATTRHQLQPPPVAPVAPTAANDGRDLLNESIHHRPPPRSGPNAAR